MSDDKYWKFENTLRLNDEKTECLLLIIFIYYYYYLFIILFSLPPNKCTRTLNCTSLSFGHNVISFSTTAKSLRFNFTDDMRIDAHVQYICRKAYIDI